MTTTKRAIILHNVSDAEHCVRNGLCEGSSLFSTHSSVDVYLKEKYNLNCRCLSVFMTPEELADHRNKISDRVDIILKELDSGIAPLLNRKFGLNINYFTPLYSYYGKHHLSAYACFIDCVRKMSNIYNPEMILFYEYRFNYSLNASTTVSDIMSLFFRNIKSEVVKVPRNRIDEKLKSVSKILINNFKRLAGCNLGSLYKKISSANRDKPGRFEESNKTILLSGPLYELDFLRYHLTRCNIIYHDFVEQGLSGFKKRCLDQDANIDFIDDYAADEIEDPLVKVFLKDIKDDLKSGIGRYIGIINLIKDVNKRYPISLGVWGIPPSSKTGAILFEHLRSNGIKVVGSQHGCLYGEVFYPTHFDLDFNRCDYYISWGFTHEDMGRIYPSKKIDTRFLPLGKTEVPAGGDSLKKIDILFPLNNSLSMIEDGMIRVLPDKLTERQTALLEYLDSIDASVYVKPFPGSDYHNCSVLPVLKRLNNIKIVDNIFLQEFLRRYSPRAVVMEIPSQPLFDVLPLDTEIFLIGDPVNPYEKKALEELKRRVHYCEGVDDAVSKIDLFIKGGLEKKRDETFFRHYMYKENTKENILNLVNGLIG